jgi:acetolactate synthase small subunit
MRKHKRARYHLIAKNRPGELAKLTDLLRSEGVLPEHLTVATLDDDEAAIELSSAPIPQLPERLARCGLRLA